VDGSWLVDNDDELERQFGPNAAEAIRHIWLERKRGGASDVESQLRDLDYVTADAGSTEDLVGRRRMAMDDSSMKERKELYEEMDEIVQDEYVRELEMGEELVEDSMENRDDIDDQKVDPNQKANGPWSETVIRVDRVQKVIRGGLTVRFRSLVVGGNANGVAGFGIGKAATPVEATGKAVRMCKRNIFFIDRYLGSGLISDLVGKQNSCRVYLRSVPCDYGMKGHPLVSQILKYAGIADCSSKSHGNRNQFNVVRATFKALMTNESLEEIALKRGKRLLNMERARRLEV